MKRGFAEALLWAGASSFVILGVVFKLMHGNLDSVRLYDAARPLMVLLPASVLVTLLLFAVHRPLSRIFPAALYLYFSFYEIKVFSEKYEIENAHSIAAVALLLLALYFLFRYIDGLKASLYVFVAALSMATATFFVIAPSLYYDPPPKVDPYFEKETLAAVTNLRGRQPDLPDIIYIVPDRYPSGTTLRSEFGYDNGAFYRKLRKRGFRVFADSWANYPKTFQSMASTFNSGYLEEFSKVYGKASSDKRPVFARIKNHLVQDRLRNLGYVFHNYGNWWEPTRFNRWAAVNYQGYPPNSLWNLSEFERALMLMTPTLQILRLFTGVEDKRECRRIRRKFRRLREVGNDAEPIFVLAHVLVPHAPIVMDATGKCLERPLLYSNEKKGSWSAYKAAFVEYLKYFNTSMLDIIDEQLRRRSPTGRKLFFVIQADEGPFPQSIQGEFNAYDFSRFSRRELKMKMGIINALFLSGTDVQPMTPLKTPVNNWRIIFNALTGSKMDLLPERIFIYPTEKTLFDFCEVTDALIVPSAPMPPCMK